MYHKAQDKRFSQNKSLSIFFFLVTRATSPQSIPVLFWDFQLESLVAAAQERQSIHTQKDAGCSACYTFSTLGIAENRRCGSEKKKTLTEFESDVLAVHPEFLIDK